MPSALSPSAAELVRERLVFDAHADSLQLALDLGRDLGVEGRGQLDLVRAARGGLGALVFVCWCDPKFIAPELGGAFERTRKLLLEFHRLAARRPDMVEFAGNAALLARARAGGRLAGIPGIEGGHSIEDDLDKLEWFFERGVRVMTLVWNNHLRWARSCQAGAGSEVPEGLNDFGRAVVRRMNELGMVVDLSHAGERTFFDALDATTQPVIASHSGCKALHGHQRNLSDDQLRALSRQGGVLGLVFCPAFLDERAIAAERRARASPEFQAIGGANDTEQFLAQYEYLMRVCDPLPADRLVDHLCHAVEVAGIEHVGIGSDFDGIQRAPRGLEDAASYGTLVELMLTRGFAPDEIRQVLGGNLQRVYARVTAPGTAADSAALVAV